MIIKTREDAARMIRAAIAMQGTTASAFGEKLNLPPSNASRLINKQGLTIRQLLEIAAALDCDLYVALLPRDTATAARAAGVQDTQ